MNKEDNNTAERILESARKIFIRDGLQGARMQDIADLAHINRAMLHYYYRDRKDLFNEVMKSFALKFISTFKINLNSELSFEKKVDYYIDYEIDFAFNNPELLVFALHEASKDPEFFKKILPENQHSTVFRKQVEEAYKKGEIITKSIHEFIIIVSSLCMFPFIGGPLYVTILKWDELKWKNYRISLRKYLPGLIKRIIFVQHEK